MILITIRGRKDTLSVGDEKGKIIKEAWKQYKLKKTPDHPLEVHGFDRQIWSGMISDINSFEETEQVKSIAEQAQDDNYQKEYEAFLRLTPQEKVVKVKNYIDAAWTSFGNPGTMPQEIKDKIKIDLFNFYQKNTRRMYPEWKILTNHIPLNRLAGALHNASVYRVVRGMAISGK
jgi:hypothetical protein